MRRHLPAFALLLVGLVGLGLAASCAMGGAPKHSRKESGARKPAGPARPITPPPPPAPGEPAPDGAFATVPVVAASGAPAVYARHFGVRPTIDTAAQPSVALTPDVDTASFHVAKAELAAGRLPPEAAVRLEEFVAATSSPAQAGTRRGFELQADWADSPLRPGYRLLRLVVRAPDEGGSAPVAMASSPEELLRAWQAGRDCVYLAQGAAVADLPVMWSRAPRTSVIGVVERGYDDARLERLARLTGGEYHARADLGAALYLAKLLEEAGGPAASAVRLRMEFDTEAVRRYRLLGWEGRGIEAGQAAPEAALAAGAEVVLLFEVSVPAPTPAPAPATVAELGRLTVSWRRPTGEEASVSLPVRPGRAEAGWGGALAAAAVAEKLRGSYWSRHVSWARLRELVARHAPGQRDLRAMVEAAERLDRRPDRFAEDLPVAEMGFDSLPVVR